MIVVVHPEHGRAIARVTDSDGLDLNMSEPEWTPAMANAAFIVKAVNAHDELLAACKAAAKILHCPDTAQLCRDAIAKAEGR